MATRSARETITTALRRIGILSEMESMSADQANDALTILNDMMQGFPARGIQYVHEPLALDTALNVPDEQTRNVMLMLVWDLADEYGKQISQKLSIDCADALNSLIAAYYVVPLAQQDSGIENRLSLGYNANIERA